MDSVADKGVVEDAAMAYVLKTGKAIYIPGLGQISPAPAEPEAVAAETKTTAK